MRYVKRQFALRRLQDIVNRFSFPFRALCEPQQIFRLQVPGRHGEDSRTRDIIERLGDQPQISQHIAHQRMHQNRQLGDDKGNLAPRQLFDQFIAMRMLAIQNRQIGPASARSMNALQFSGHPARFAFLVRRFHDADAPAFDFIRRKNFIGEIRADFVLPNHLLRHSQDIRRRAIIFRQCHTKRSGIPPRLPPRKTL